LDKAFDLFKPILSQQWKNQDSTAILLSDFAQGHFFLDIVQHWLHDAGRSQRLHCFAFIQEIDAALPLALSGSIHGNDALRSIIDELKQKWPPPVAGFHRIFLNQHSVILTVVYGQFEAQLSEVSGSFDVFLLNHSCENLDLISLKQIWRLSQANSQILTSATEKNSQAQLIKAGFSPQLHDSRRFLTASCLRSPKPLCSAPEQKAAIVIGAGIAGCSVANSLALRNWKIQLIDSAAEIASQASGNHIGLCHPTFSLDDNFQARLSRAGFLLTQQKLNALSHKSITAVHFGADGHFQIATSNGAAELMQAILKQQQTAAFFVEWLSAAQAKSLLAIDCQFGGWWFPQGMWINPASACNGYINESIENIKLSLNTCINRVEYLDKQWHLFSSNNTLIASTDTLILANAHDAARLLPHTELGLSSSLRSVTKIPANQLKTTNIGISGQSYLTAELGGFRCAGAALVNEEMSETEVQANNLRDLANLIGPTALLQTSNTQTRQCIRPNSADRLPLVGAVPTTAPITHSVHQLFHIPKSAGIYAVLGFGARGLSWHVLAAEVLACQLNKEPQGIERSLIDAIDPSRFILRRLRKLSAQKRS